MKSNVVLLSLMGNFLVRSNVELYGLSVVTHWRYIGVHQNAVLVLSQKGVKWYDVCMM